MQSVSRAFSVCPNRGPQAPPASIRTDVRCVLHGPRADGSDLQGTDPHCSPRVPPLPWQLSVGHMDLGGPSLQPRTPVSRRGFAGGLSHPCTSLCVPAHLFHPCTSLSIPHPCTSLFITADLCPSLPIPTGLQTHSPPVLASVGSNVWQLPLLATVTLFFNVLFYQSQFKN